MALDTATTASAAPIALEPSERDSILAGLRLLQLHNDGLVPSDESLDLIEAIAGESGEPLTNDSIDALCERINS